MSGKSGKKLGVIILNWNGLQLLKDLIPKVVETTVSPDVDLIVADNGSEDGSVEWLQKNFPEVKVIGFEQNYGFAAGYNRAVELCDYPFIVLLNSDVETTPGWWQPMLEIMEQDSSIGALQPKIKSYKDRESFEYAGAAGGFLDALGYPFCRGRLFDKVEKDVGQYDDGLKDITWASGACLMTRRELYLQSGGLDPLFFAHMEEIDLCCRLLTMGKRVCVYSGSAVFHMGGASLSQGNPKKTYLNFRNNLLLLHKNLPEKKGKVKLFFRRLSDTLAFAMYVMKFDIPNAKAIIKAHRDFVKMRKNYNTFPSQDVLSKQAGAKHYAVIEHYLLRRDRIKL